MPTKKQKPEPDPLEGGQLSILRTPQRGGGWGGRVLSRRPDGSVEDATTKATPVVSAKVARKRSGPKRMSPARRKASDKAQKQSRKRGPAPTTKPVRREQEAAQRESVKHGAPPTTPARARASERAQEEGRDVAEAREEA